MLPTHPHKDRKIMSIPDDSNNITQSHKVGGIRGLYPYFRGRKTVSKTPSAQGKDSPKKSRKRSTRNSRSSQTTTLTFIWHHHPINDKPELYLLARQHLGASIYHNITDHHTSYNINKWEAPKWKVKLQNYPLKFEWPLYPSSKILSQKNSASSTIYPSSYF